MMSNKPFSEACEENKQPIAEVLQKEFANVSNVLEIGSGTGQHAVYFAQLLPHVQWQCSDLAHHLQGVRAWLDEADLPNTPPPLALDVKQPWIVSPFDAIFSANTVHIMSWQEVEAMFKRINEVLRPGGVFCLYGPFNERDRYTSDSNGRFDAWLKSRDPLSGIRDVDALNDLAQGASLDFTCRYSMPVNNQIIVWKKHNSQE